MADIVPAPKQNKPHPAHRFAYPIDGLKFYLSPKEKLICEVFVRTNGNKSECAREVGRVFGKTITSETVRRWLDRRRLITRYLEEQLDKKAELDSFTPDDWKLLGIQVIKGKRTMNAIQAQIWRDFGRLEVYKEHGSGGDRNTNIQINFGERE